MVLRALGVQPAECSLDRLRALLPDKCTSVWTVDLAYVLHHFGVRFRFLTTTVGVDPAYQAEPFYKPTLDADSLRVNDLFAKAKDHNVAIEHRSLDEAELTTLLQPQPIEAPRGVVASLRAAVSTSSPAGARGGTGAAPGTRPAPTPLPPIAGSPHSRRSSPAAPRASMSPFGSRMPQQPANIVVALVDRRYLYPTAGVMESCLSYCFGGYVGHYVVLVGYDAARDAFRLLDPARPAAEPLLVPAKELHAARRSHGTDEDLIVVPIEQPQTPQSNVGVRPPPYPAGPASPAA